MRRALALAAAVLAAGALLLFLRSERPDGRIGPAHPESAAQVPPRAPTLAAAPRGAAPKGGLARDDPRAPGEDAPATGEGAGRHDSILLRVDVVDGTTGNPVQASWGSAEAAVREVFEFVRSPGEDGVAWSPPSGTPSGSAAQVEFRDSGRIFLGTVRVAVPDQYVAREAAVPFVPLAADTKELWALLPVDRSVPLYLSATAPDGRPALGCEIQAVEAAGRRRPLDVQPAGAGEHLVRGIPFLPGEPVAVAIQWEPEPGHERPTEKFLLDTAISDPEWRSIVPSDSHQTWRAEARLKGPCGRVLVLDAESIVDFQRLASYALGRNAQRQLLARMAGSALSRGRVRVRALGRDGLAIPGAVVRLGGGVRVADGDGRATFDEAAAGAQPLSMAVPGRLPASASIDAPEGGDVAVELREPAGAALEVSVVGEDGRPRPFAAVRLSVASFDVVAGVQRLDPFTDALGWRTFARVVPGEVEVTAQWGSRTGKAGVVLQDGGRTTVRIIVK